MRIPTVARYTIDDVVEGVPLAALAPYVLASYGPPRPLRPPAGMCAEHLHVWREWGRVRYDPQHPKEPGGGMVMDSRTGPVVRAAAVGWHAQKQQRMAEELCRSRCPAADGGA